MLPQTGGSAEASAEGGNGPVSTTGGSVAMDTGTDAGDSGATGADDDVDPCGDFIGCPPDAGSDTDACNPGHNECAVGSKCVWYAPSGEGTRRNAARCIPVTGDRPAFASCELPTGIGPEITDDCGADSYCLNAGATSHGFCAPIGKRCDAYPDTSYVAENGSEYPAACLHTPCSPLVESPCPGSMACRHFPASLYANVMCWEVDLTAAKPLGAGCDYGQCEDGTMCIPADYLPNCDNDRCCASACDRTAPDCPDPGAVCEPFVAWGGAGPGFDNLGVCALPDAFD